MLLVKTVLDKSLIQGIGLFADQEIKKGEIVWKYDELTTLAYDNHHWYMLKDALPTIAFNNMERFAYCMDGNWHIDIDDGKFMNHLSIGQTLSYHDNGCYAIRDIHIGEELTLDYGEFCEKNNSPTCKECGLCRNFK